MDLRVQPAKPEDARFLGWVVIAAGRGSLERGWYDIVLGLPEAEAVTVMSRAITAKADSFWKTSNFLVAELDGEPAGALANFPAGAWGDASGALAEAVQPLGWSEADLAAAWDRGRYVFTCVMQGETAPWIIENVAVRPEARGCGVAAALLEAAFAEGRSRGLEAAQLSCLIGNEPAERAYRKAGFELAEEARHPDFAAAVGCPGMRRWVRRL